MPPQNPIHAVLRELDPSPETGMPWEHLDALQTLHGLHGRVDQILRAGRKRGSHHLALRRWPAGVASDVAYRAGDTVSDLVSESAMSLQADGDGDLARLLRQTLDHVVVAERVAADALDTDRRRLDDMVERVGTELRTDERVRWLGVDEPGTPGCWCPGRDASTLQAEGRIAVDMEAEPDMADLLGDVITSIVITAPGTDRRTNSRRPWGQMWLGLDSAEHALRLADTEVKAALSQT